MFTFSYDRNRIKTSSSNFTTK